MKVMTVLGTRPEIIRLSLVIQQLDQHSDHLLVHTGQNYDPNLNDIFFKELGVRAPDVYLGIRANSIGEQIGRILMETEKEILRFQPDRILILGDTNSGLVSIIAKRMVIPVFHMEAGNRCFDERVPEEINRRIVDHSADINLPYSAIARDYLLAEGLPADRIVKTGSPMLEVLTHYRPGIDASDVHARLGVERGRYVVVSCHREENVDSDDRLHRLAETLGAVAALHDEPILFSAHPRTRKRIEALGLIFDPRVRVMKPLGFLDYNALQLHARAVLSDSGTISEEAALLGFPALNIRDAQERPEAMEEGVAMLVGIDRDRVLQGLEILATRSAPPHLPADYAIPDVSEKIVRLILSYTGYVRRTVWKDY